VIEVIPSILTSSAQEFEAMVKKLEPHVQRIHIDIVDGKFAKNKTIFGWEELSKIKTKLAIDVHLMVQDPIKHLSHWYESQAERLILHIESEGDLVPILMELENKGKRRAIALNPETPAEKITSLLPHLDFVQFMTVHPGFYGSPFVHEVLEHIDQFHMAQPHVPIAVDGGITPETAPLVVKAGASILVSGSYILQSNDIAQAIKSLQL